MPKHKHIKFKIPPNLLPNAAKFRGMGLIGFLCLALLLSAGTFLLTIDNAAAQSPESGASAAAETAQTAGSDQTNVQVDVNILPVLSLAVYPVGNHTTETGQVVLEPVSGGDLATNMLDLVVRTNVRTGYQLSIKDEDTTTALVHTTDSTRTIPALDASTNTASFPDNRWGYSVGAYNADNSEFHAVPAATPNLIAQSEELLPGDGETTTVTFGVKIDNTVVNGIYEDKVVFTASPNLIPSIFKVTIHYRFADGTEAAPDYSENYVTGATYSVTSPEVAGYTPSQAVVSGTVDDEDVEVTVTYTTASLTSIITMQQMTSAVCDATPTPSYTDTDVPGAVVKDARDGRTYRIHKLADGKCWMAQDLNYALSTNTPLNPETSDVPTSWTPNNNTQATTGVTWDTISATVARSYTDGVRTYYNHFAASAGTDNDDNPAGSVCPRGWTLPGNGFQELMDAYHLVANTSSAVHMLLGGTIKLNYTGYYKYDVGQMADVASSARYWISSAPASSNTASFFYIFDSMAVHGSDNRGSGLALRCVAR